MTQSANLAALGNNVNSSGVLGTAGGGTGITAFGTGVATALGSNVTGSGGIVLATSPTLVTPALGTPSSGIVTNLTGTASININGTVGATTTSTGAFTTLAYTGTLTGGTGVVNLGSGQFYKDASGNIGVGTSSPVSKLQVVSSVAITATAGAQYLLMGNQNGGGTNLPAIIQAANGQFNFGRGNSWSDSVGGTFTSTMLLDTSGNLFVGGTTQNTANAPVYARTTAKAWVNFSDNGTTCTINQSFNVSSITRNATGNYGINFTSGIATANACAIANGSQNDGVNANAFVNGVNSYGTSVQVISSLQAKFCSVVVFD